MKAKELARKLEAYEEKAYEGGYGLDWLSDVGEGLKFYLIDCDDNNVKPTFDGLMSWINNLHVQAESI